jgi:hypothetical protein
MKIQEIIGILTDLTQFAEIKIDITHPLCTISRFLEKKRGMSVNELEFTVRTANCLNNANIQTIEELAAYTAEDLLKIRGFGKICLKEVQDHLAQLNLKLGSKVDDSKAAEKFAKSALLIFIQRLEKAERELDKWKYYLSRHGSTPEEVLYSISQYRLQKEGIQIP